MHLTNPLEHSLLVCLSSLHIQDSEFELDVSEAFKPEKQSFRKYLAQVFRSATHPRYVVCNYAGMPGRDENNTHRLLLYTRKENGEIPGVN